MMTVRFQHMYSLLEWWGWEVFLNQEFFPWFQLLWICQSFVHIFNNVLNEPLSSPTDKQQLAPSGSQCGQEHPAACPYTSTKVFFFLISGQFILFLWDFHFGFWQFLVNLNSFQFCWTVLENLNSGEYAFHQTYGCYFQTLSWLHDLSIILFGIFLTKTGTLSLCEQPQVKFYRLQNYSAFIFLFSYITTNTRKLVSLSHISLPYGNIVFVIVHKYRCRQTTSILYN